MTDDRLIRVFAPDGSGFEVAAVTDRGPIRKENQDVSTAVLRADGDGCVLALADGMGGHAGGREAAEAAVESAMHVMEAGSSGRGDVLATAVEAATTAVGAVRDQLGGFPGTTLVLAAIEGADAAIANIGDSRAYLLRDGAARQLTDNHSWVGEQVRLGALDPGSARHHAKRNIITRAVMGDPVVADQYSIEMRPGDTLLLCSDGLWEPLSDTAIAELIKADAPLAVVLERACDAALAAGGTDNVTIVAARRRRGRHSDKV